MESVKKNILLIGGTGFLGGALQKYFSEQGCRVVVFSRHHSTKPHHYSLPERGWEALLQILKQQKDWYVIDLAYTTVPNSSFDDPIADFSDNLYLIHKNLLALKNLSLNKYVYISSGGAVYGNIAMDRITEEVPNFPLSPYGITKMACERYVNMYHQHYALPALIVRPSNVYGPGQIPFRGQGLIATILGSVLNNIPVQIFGKGENVRDYIFITDVCRAIDHLLIGGSVGEIYNVGSGTGLSNMEVALACKKLVAQDGYDLQFEYLPERPFDVKRNVLCFDKLQQETGWRPQTEFAAGLNVTWEWIRNQSF